MTDIVDDIDALINDQLESGEPLTGYTCGDPTFPKCPHCNRHWHGLQITERIAAMYASGRYDDTYSAADDDSPVLCEGSEFIGPIPESGVQRSRSGWGDMGFNWVPHFTFHGPGSFTIAVVPDVGVTTVSAIEAAVESAEFYARDLLTWPEPHLPPVISPYPGVSDERLAEDGWVELGYISE